VDARRIGGQILLNNAFDLFLQPKDRLWKHRSKPKPPVKWWGNARNARKG